MPNLPPDTTQSILKDFTNTKLCTYQIAQKYNLNQRTVKSIVVKSVGQSVFDKKEELAFDNLIREIKSRYAVNYSANQIAAELGISRSTCLNLIEKIAPQTPVISSLPTDNLHIIEIENDLGDEPGDPEPKLPLKQDTATEDSIPQSGQEQTSQIKSLPQAPAPYTQGYSSHGYFNTRRGYPHRNSRDHTDSWQQKAHINLNGFSISFDSSRPGAGDILNKIIKIIMEQ